MSPLYIISATPLKTTLASSNNTNTTISINTLTKSPPSHPKTNQSIRLQTQSPQFNTRLHNLLSRHLPPPHPRRLSSHPLPRHSTRMLLLFQTHPRKIRQRIQTVHFRTRCVLLSSVRCQRQLVRFQERRGRIFRRRRINNARGGGEQGVELEYIQQQWDEVCECGGSECKE